LHTAQLQLIDPSDMKTTTNWNEQKKNREGAKTKEHKTGKTEKERRKER
jgi:hypothetical protein